MSDKIIIVDFEDSFTHNIASTLFPFEKKLRVVPHQEFFEKTYLSLLNSEKNNVAVILGPGPGHPSEFCGYFSKICLLFERENIYLMGICLGHQILGLMNNKIIKDALVKVHGQTTKIEFKGQLRTVQRYNSLSVYENEVSDKEIPILYFTRGISYQFHPESIGTLSPEIFFRDLLTFIHSR